MILGRLLSGLGDAYVMINAYIYVLNFDNNDKYIGYVEASIGVGFVLGPVLGSTLYELLGFSSVQYFTILFPILGLFLSYIVLDSKEAKHEPENDSFKYKVMTLDNLIYYGAVACSMFCYSFYSSFMAKTLKEDYHLS